MLKCGYSDRGLRCSVSVAMIFLFSAVTSISDVFITSSVFARDIVLPAPDHLLPASDIYSFPLLKGVIFDPQNPLNLDFVFDAAHAGSVSKEEAAKLIRYFLAGLTINEDDL